MIRRNIAPIAFLMAGVVIVGIIICVAGSGGGNPEATPDLAAEIPGAIMIIVPLLTAVVAVIIGIGRAAIRDARRYAAWKRTLTPQQLAQVHLIEAAALTAGAVAAHEWMNRPEARLHREALTYSQVHGGSVADAERSLRYGQAGSWVDDPRSGAHRMWG
jgi:hypothetical protein